MFNRLLRCISTAKNSLNLNPSRSISSVFVYSSKPQSNTDKYSLSKKSFCSKSVAGVVDEPPDPVGENLVKQPVGNTPAEMTEAELNSLIESDPAIDKRYKILQLEVDVMRHAGKKVPEKLKAHHWLELIKAESRSQRRKYLQFLFTTEKKQENQKKKKEAARIEREETRPFVPDDKKSEYCLHNIAMFMRIYDTTMNNFYHTRLIHAMMFGPKLIIDCGHYAQMTPRECAECAKQLAYMFGQNRLHPEPFDLHFCNVNKSSLLMQKLHRILPPLYEPDFPLNISEKSYTELFDKSKLVYLTPDCNNDMRDYDHDSLYIIGGIVDKSNSEPLSLARAKKEGLKMAKLPLDKYLLWGSGSGKRLALNQMVNILTDIRITGDWQKAFKHVPRRKLERSVDDLNSDSVPNKKFEKNDRPFRPFRPSFSKIERNDGPFRPSEEKIRSSFSFKDRQKRSFNK